MATTASLLAHLAQLVLHAVPHATEIDRSYAIEFFATGIRGFDGRTLNAGIVERRVQPPEGGDGPLHHCRHLCFFGDIASDADRVAAGGNAILGCGTKTSTSASAAPASANALAVASPIPETAPVTSATALLKDLFTNAFLLARKHLSGVTPLNGPRAAMLRSSPA
jgi:hypothetical protein